jgi:hypothetical protein
MMPPYSDDRLESTSASSFIAMSSSESSEDTSIILSSDRSPGARVWERRGRRTVTAVGFLGDSGRLLSIHALESGIEWCRFAHLMVLQRLVGTSTHAADMSEPRGVSVRPFNLCLQCLDFFFRCLDLALKCRGFLASSFELHRMLNPETFPLFFFQRLRASQPILRVHL